MVRKERLITEGIRLVVLDDDPTGIQTVHGCLILTDWSRLNLITAFKDHEPYFYLFTNTRAYPPEKARKIVKTVIGRVVEVNKRYGYKLVFICRSDSTLRSHFPLEMDAVAEEAGIFPDARFLIPAFFEANRITRADTHYWVRSKEMIPCHETEFAQDPVFGYKTAYLPGYIEEKTIGQVLRHEVYSVSRALLKPDRRAELERLLQGIPTNSFVVVNAENYSELNAFSIVILDKLAHNNTYLFQSAASFVKSLVGCPAKNFVGAEVVTSPGPGLIIVGSHVDKTSRQLKNLLQEPQLQALEVDVRALLQEPGRLLHELSQKLEVVFGQARTPVVYTSRHKVSFQGKHEQLFAGQKISTILSQLVAQVKTKPSFLIAKGGITAHDVLANGLGIKHARVLGQVSSGIPVIRMPGDHFWADMPYVIFPGNVGDDNGLRNVYRSLTGITDAKNKE